MKLAVVTLMRNEIDIARPFLSHLAALFDFAVLLDHGSIDGTERLQEAACRQMPGWSRWHVAISGHHQALLTGFAMRHLFETTDADIVCFLDADEFLDVPDRATLETALMPALETDRAAAQFAWTDCLPERRDGAPPMLGDPIWTSQAETPYPKIAIPRRLYQATGGAARPSSGAHTVDPGDGGPLAYLPAGRLLHLPLRSVGQLRQKIVSGALGTLARLDNLSHESAHWFDALTRLAAADIGESDLILMARRYGHRPEDWTPVGQSDLPRLGFTRRMFDVAGRSLDLPDPPRQPSDGWRAVAAILRNWRAEDGRDIALVLDGDVLRRAAEPDAPAKTDPLAGLQARLDQALRERAAAIEEARSLRDSTSFRITAPLRAAMSALRRGR